MKFLENNGKNLHELSMDNVNRSLKLSIAQFCPNLQKIFILFKDDEMDILKTIFNSCEYLESINVWCGNWYLNEKELLEGVAKYSPKNFFELKIYNQSISELIPEDLESFFISWGNRLPQKPLTLIISKDGICNYGLDVNEENIRTIEKYKQLGIIKKFEFETKEF